MLNVYFGERGESYIMKYGKKVYLNKYNESLELELPIYSIKDKREPNNIAHKIQKFLTESSCVIL